MLNIPLGDAEKGMNSYVKILAKDTKELTAQSSRKPLQIWMASYLHRISFAVLIKQQEKPP